MRGYNFHRIVKSLNEGIDNPAPVVQPEPTAGVDIPTKVYQCKDCGCFYLGTPSVNESCNECGGEGTEVADVKKLGEGVEEPKNTDKVDDLKITTEGMEDPEIQSEAEVVVNEALNALDRSDFKKFNESYRPRSRMTSKGELEIILESNGKIGSARRRMTSRQKASYKLAESIATKPAVSKSAKRNESVRARRRELIMMNESRRIRIQACKILERQGASYDFKKFNESMNKFLESRDYRKMFEAVDDDTEIGTSELDQMTPDEISDSVSTVMNDAGLDVVSSDVSIDGDTATVNVRVEDSNDIEVRTSELEDTLSDVFGTDVQIAGPVLTEGDDELADMTVIINPEEDDTINEGTETCDCGEEDCPICNPKNEGCNGKKTKKEGMMSSECMSSEGKKKMMSSEMKKNESLRRKSVRSRVNEKFTKGVGTTPLFALLATDSADNEPQFLAQDDSLVSGNEEHAEDLARVFVSEDAAKSYITSAGLDGRFEPVSITVITNEGDTEMNDPEKIINEGEEDEDPEKIKTDNGNYFIQEGCYYCEKPDGKIVECDKSEYDAAKASAYDLDAAIKESYRGRRSRRK